MRLQSYGIECAFRLGHATAWQEKVVCRQNTNLGFCC